MIDAASPAAEPLPVDAELAHARAQRVWVDAEARGGARGPFDAAASRGEGADRATDADTGTAIGATPADVAPPSAASIAS